MLIRGPLTRLLARRTVRTVLGLLLLVEAIFIAESFSTIMERTIRNGGTAWDLSRLMLFKMPEVVDFALPLALMLGLYFAISGARDDNELVICATSGVPWTRIPAFAMVVGTLGLCLSLIFSGILTPLSTFAMRLSLVDLQSRLVLQQLREPGQRTIVRSHDGQTVIATPSRDPRAERGNLFLYKPEPDGGWRVKQADDWSATGPDERGNYAIRMRTFRESSGSAEDTEAPRRGAGTVRQVLNGVSVTVSSLTMDVQRDDLIRVADRVRRRNELLIFDLAGRAIRSSGDVPDQTARRFGEMLARALLCPIAALLAVATAAWSATRTGKYVVLPGAILLVLAFDVFGRTLLGDGAARGGAALWTSALAFGIAGLGLPLAYILWRAELIVTPSMRRA